MTAFKTKFLLSILAISAIIHWACQPDEELLIAEPELRAMFVDGRTLFKLDSQLTSMEGQLDTFGRELDTLLQDAAFYDDTIDALGVLLNDSNWVEFELENGDLVQIQPLLDEYFDSLDDTRAMYDEVFTADTTLQNHRDTLVSAINRVQESDILLTSIVNRANDEVSLVFNPDEDSSTSWRLPLDMNATRSELGITILDKTYAVDITYEINTVVDEFNNIIRQASNIQVISNPAMNGFDSLNDKNYCPSDECIDSEVNLVFYY